MKPARPGTYLPTLLLAALFSACAGTPSSRPSLHSMMSTFDAKVGERSASRAVWVDNMAVRAYALNAPRFHDLKKLVVCLHFERTYQAGIQSFAIRPAQTMLVLQNGQRLQPSAYFDDAYCPAGGGIDRDYDIGSDFDKVVLRAVTPESIANAAPPHKDALIMHDIALRFDIAPIDPYQDFTIETGPAQVNGIAKNVPPMLLQLVYGSDANIPR